MTYVPSRWGVSPAPADCCQARAHHSRYSESERATSFGAQVGLSRGPFQQHGKLIGPEL
jgi:hypothetical protein